MKQKRLVSAVKLMVYFTMLFLFISMFASCVSAPSPVSDEYVGRYEGELISSYVNSGIVNSSAVPKYPKCI